MLKNFDSPDVYMLTGFYFCHVDDWLTGGFCILFAILDCMVLTKK